MGFREKLLQFMGIEVLTNRDAIIEELYRMDGEQFAIRTGLVFSDAIAEDIRKEGFKGYSDWLKQPATRDRILT